MNHHTCKNGWHLCASHFCFAVSVTPHRKAPLPGVRRQIFLPDAGDLDIVAFLDEGEQGHKFVRAALHFQRDAAVVTADNTAMAAAQAELDAAYLRWEQLEGS